MPSTMIERSGTTSPTIGPSEWALIAKQADVLAQADIIPQAYRRKPANIMVAAMTGRHFGWDVLTAMRNGNVINGVWGMKPEAMLGLARQAGHSVTSIECEDGATVKGKRADNGDEMTVTFTMADARRAGLAGGATWKSYPTVMCYWRAVGLLCRLLFSDLTAGVHTTEELGGAVNDDDEYNEPPEEVRAYLPLSDQAYAEFTKACATVELDPALVFERAFPEGQPDPLTDEHLPTMRDAYKALLYERQVAEDDDIADAEIVDPPYVDDAEPTSLGDNDIRPASRAQIGKIKGEYHRLGINERDAQLETTAEVVGRDITTHNHLTRDEAHRLIEELSVLGDIAVEVD